MITLGLMAVMAVLWVRAMVRAYEANNLVEELTALLYEARYGQPEQAGEAPPVDPADPLALMKAQNLAVKITALQHRGEDVPPALMHRFRTADAAVRDATAA